ncbi:MobA/MobL family protein [Bosea sp. TND4EK4]|uniref:MobA/MobL family protein n=1 Tax=Bosea sp. TND4EK4 TaxID=1907408 RepID=UPI000955BF96|nr:MobA/MobL family protein [Bosea sp. TND4EK4]SIQ36718.1 MobA/MobL family protein [Bosea sp. TND4EK4]
MMNSPDADVIARMLKRASDRQAKQAQKRVENAVKRNPFKGLGHTTESAFAAALSKALRNHGAKAKGGRASIRMTAPDTGGRPFHFDHTAVSKKSIALKQGETAPATNTYGKRRKEFAKPTSHTTTSGAHMAYIERDGAAEAFDLDKELDAAMGRGGRGRTPGGMQGYLEDEEKLAANDKANGLGPSREVAFSFGTPEMGETLEERMAFWDLAEQHAERGNGTIQHRLIVELPHECSAEDRLAVMRSFTKKYEDDRVPYWCVLHAPVEGKNDDRNFHAHIVLLNRPAWKEPFPEGGKSFRREDGPLVDTWTFAATEEIRDKHDNYPTQYPLRENVLEDYRGKFVASERKRFAQAVNEQMIASGVPVRYDHRSYKAMGLPVEAMKSVKGMILEKAKAGERLVLDSGQTKRLVDFEIERIARERQVDLSEVERIKRAVRSGTTRLTHLDREARHLGRKGLVRHAGHALKKAYAHAALRYALAKQAHVKREIELRLESFNLRRYVEATDPQASAPLREKIERGLKAAQKADEEAAARDAADPKRKPAPEGAERPKRKTERVVEGLTAQLDALPDPEIVTLIHREAKAELKRAEREHAEALARTESRMARALRAWGVLAERPAPVELPAHTEHAGAPPVPNYAPRDEPEAPKSLYRHYPESAHDMIDQMFNTPQSRIALELTNRISDHIQEAAKIKVPGKETAEVVMDEVKALVAAFKQGPAHGELALTLGPRDRSPLAGVPRGAAEVVRAQRAEFAARVAAGRAPEPRPAEEPTRPPTPPAPQPEKPVAAPTAPEPPEPQENQAPDARA